MSEKEEYRIIELIKSLSQREREKGVEMFINAFEKKAKNWLLKVGHSEYIDDIWIESAHTMTRAIQSEAYKKISGVAIYTYFHTILRGVSIRYANDNKRQLGNTDIEDNIENINDSETPQSYIELTELLNALESCLIKLKTEDHKLLEDIILKGKKLFSIIEEYNLKNKNNAKQKYFKLKKALLHCLKKKGYE
ncbi:MAG TPA: hypothetical protein VK175_16765 [Leadbetterella sp.]|nr:hypothetical protein [Leadbetterella sp.]